MQGLTGHFESFDGPQLARGPWVGRPWFKW